MTVGCRHPVPASFFSGYSYHVAVYGDPVKRAQKKQIVPGNDLLK